VSGFTPRFTICTDHSCNISLFYRNLVTMRSFTGPSTTPVYDFGWCGTGENALEEFTFSWMEGFSSLWICRVRVSPLNRQ